MCLCMYVCTYTCVPLDLMVVSVCSLGVHVSVCMYVYMYTCVLLDLMVVSVCSLGVYVSVCMYVCIHGQTTMFRYI
jgi:hypothetical protein